MLEFNGTVIVLAISFVIFVILENFIFYRPLKKVLTERENYIKENEDTADKSFSAAKVLVEEKEQKLSEARAKSSKIISDTGQKTQEKYDIAVKEAKLNSNNAINEEKNRLDEEKSKVQEELKSEIGAYASGIISKILKKEVAVVNVNDEVVEKAMRGEL